MKKKILCTLGPASFHPQTIQRLTELNVDLFRINLSHTRPNQIPGLVHLIRNHSNVPICLDTQGAQARTGQFVSETVSLLPGDLIEITSSEANSDAKILPIYPPSVVTQLLRDDLICIDYDSVVLRVVSETGKYKAQVIRGGQIRPNSAIAIPDRSLNLPPLTEVDEEAIRIGLTLGIDHIALSFTNRREDVDLLRKKTNTSTQIIAKIESRQGLNNLPDILDVADAILIDRGDLSREIALESLPFAQKYILNLANASQVPAYVATNLLESMVSSPRPTRAEVNDVVNTLLDGADGLVLAAETAIGKFPIQCASMIRTLIEQYESQLAKPKTQPDEVPSCQLIRPHGGTLVNRFRPEYDLTGINEFPKLEISNTAMLDVEQISIGTFSPIEGFMTQETLDSVLAYNRLPNGLVWTMPILLQLPPSITASYSPGNTIALTRKGKIQAFLHLDEVFRYDLHQLATKWFGTDDINHPGVATLFKGTDSFLAGKVDLLKSAPGNRNPYELTPSQSRAIFQRIQWQRVIGFHTRNVAHMAHEHLQLTALHDYHGDGVFVHPVIGPKKPGDFSSDIILKTYQHLITNQYPHNKIILGGFSTYARYAGPREAVFTALCRKNFGCSHFIVGRDHTGVGDFYPPKASQLLFDQLDDMAITPIFFDEVYYCNRCGSHVEDCDHKQEHSQRISGTQAREILSGGEALPEWYMRRGVSDLILEEIRRGNQVFVA